jgi:hypothetical protein
MQYPSDAVPGARMCTARLGPMAVQRSIAWTGWRRHLSLTWCHCKSRNQPRLPCRYVPSGPLGGFQRLHCTVNLSLPVKHVPSLPRQVVCLPARIQFSRAGREPSHSRRSYIWYRFVLSPANPHASGDRRGSLPLVKRTLTVKTCQAYTRRQFRVGKNLRHFKARYLHLVFSSCQLG